MDANQNPGNEGGQGTAPPPQSPPPNSSGPTPTGPVSPEDRTNGMLCHLLGIPLGFLGPLIIWLIKKDQSAFVDDQGKEALNFVITVIIAGFLTCGIASIVGMVFLIIGAVEANKGVWYRYPINIRFIK